MTEADVRTVLAAYALDGADLRVVSMGNAGGWSGSRLWRVRCPTASEFCLRCWSTEHPTRDRLQFIHRVLLQVKPDLPLIAAPIRTIGGATFVEHEGQLWEVSIWRPGKADFHDQPNRRRLQAAMNTLARFHNAAARVETSAAPAPAIQVRAVQWGAMNGGGLRKIKHALTLAPDNPLGECAWRLLKKARSALGMQRFWSELTAALRPTNLIPAIRDIHHDHVLFDGDEVSGLIDFGSLQLDTPLTDIARLVGSLVGDDQSAREFAFNAYAELRPLSATDIALVNLLDHTGVVLGGLNWLKWLYLEHRDMGPIEPIARRLDEIVKRLEILTSS